MHTISLTWQQATTLACALLAIAIGLYVAPAPQARRVAPFLRECAMIAGLYALWQLAGTLSVTGTDGAFDRARWILHAEHDVRLPSEHDLQHLIAGHKLITEACNLYYATMHFTMLFVFLCWLFVRHREAYAPIRTTLALTTLACLLVQLMPVAPPRLMPGFTDTAVKYGQSVYGLGFDSLSAMPSVHVAWAVLIGWFVARVSDSPWRWIGPLHACVTVFVVVATANHFWADGIVAVALLVLCRYVQLGLGLLAARIRLATRRTAEEPISLSSDSFARILR